MEKLNYGFDAAKQQIDEDPINDWMFGAIRLSGVADKVAGLVTAVYAWPNPINGIYPRVSYAFNHCIIFFQEIFSKYFPKGEVQNDTQEKMDCVTRGHVNELEKQFDYAITEKLFCDENIQWLKDNYYFNKQTGRIDFSNRIPAIMSGTTPNGNSLKAPIEWIRNNGLHPKSVLNEFGLIFSRYYKKSDITQEMLDLGLEFKKRFPINYITVPNKDFANFSGGIKWEIFDNYVDTYDGDYIKRLAENYNFYSSGYQLIINEIKKNEGENMLIQIEVAKKLNSPDYLIRDKNNPAMWHRIGNEKVFHSLVGDFPAEIEEMEIADESIGEPIYLSSSLADMIVNFFLKLKGK